MIDRSAIINALRFVRPHLYISCLIYFDEVQDRRISIFPAPAGVEARLIDYSV